MTRCPRCKRGAISRPAARNGNGKAAYHCNLCSWEATYDEVNRQWVDEKGASPDELSSTGEAPSPANQAETMLAQRAGVMCVTDVKLTLKLSCQMGAGIWKGIEVGANAQVNDDHLNEAWEYLHELIAEKLDQVWADPTPETLAANSVPAKLPTGEVLDPSFCTIHQTKMREWDRDGRKWYSHKLDDGAWCKGKPAKVA